MTTFFNNIYENKKILVTGHTGFKGSWLTMWLLSLGAKVIGYSLGQPSQPNNFEICNLTDRIVHIQGDVTDYNHLQSVFREHTPDIVFHLAAQPLVIRSFEQPQRTFETNMNGTLNILECIRTTHHVKAAVLITSDKCYRNVEWDWGYRETDELGGNDPYSASKGCAELIARSYIASFFKTTETAPHIATARAGNVIGGGDWAEYRIIPDCVTAWAHNKKARVRNPKATRPWQHVLEPLSGYLWLGTHLYTSAALHGEPFNFGPDQNVNQSVEEMLHTFQRYWEEASWEYVADANRKESMLLKLSCDKALHFLHWHAVLSFEETVAMTADWYKKYYAHHAAMYEYSLEQILLYTKKAIQQNLPWIKHND